MDADTTATIVALVLSLGVLVGFALVCRSVIRVMLRIVRGWLTSSQPIATPASNIPSQSSVQTVLPLRASPASVPPVSGEETADHQKTLRDKSSGRQSSESACRAVLKSLTIPHDVKPTLLKEIMASIESGESDAGNHAAIRHLAGTGWTWPEFDRWALEFEKTEEWPSMWRALGLDEEVPVEPTSVADAIDRLTVAEMKDWLKIYAPGLTPMPKKREEFEQACRTHLAWEQIREAAQVRYQDALDGYRERREEAKCRLLAHTLSMTFYTHRNYAEHKKSGVARFAVIAGGDDPVEQAFAERFNRGELKDQLPPFFPGDRCDLLPCLEKDVKGSD